MIPGIRSRLLPLLVALFAACAAPAPAPTPVPPTVAPATPTAVAVSVFPTALAAASVAPTAVPTPPATASPAAPSPTASAVAVPSTGPPTTPGASPAPPSATTFERLEALLAAERDARGMPGIAAAVIFPDGTRWSDADGQADTQPARDATPDTPFVVGSITKTFVAATILQLVEEGVVSLDDRLEEWLPDYRGADAITLRQLLNHTSGVFNYFEHPRYNAAVFGAPEETWTPEEILSRFRHAPHFPVGQGYRYSNTGFILLGMVIEEETGNSLGEELRTRFFDPLGLDETYFQGDGPPPPVSAQGYLRRQAGLVEITDGTDYRPTTSAATVAWAAGGIVSSANDLATWARALYGGAVLGPATLHEMIGVDATPYAGGTYGLGTRTRTIDGAQAFGHLGSLRGFQAAMWHVPTENVTFVVLSNLGRADVNPTITRLASIALP